MNARLAKILPKIISANQSGFIKGRQISKNILLAQEIINEIGKKQSGRNVAMKLDMTKAYDRVTWSFLYQMMRQLGFSEGDPISPSLFVICAELLSTMLNNLYANREFNSFSMGRGGPQINHLAFADDVIIFSNGRTKTLQLIMAKLSKYEAASSQAINKNKSYFVLALGASLRARNKVARITGMHQKELPIKYLGCPLFTGRQKIAYYSEMMSKVTSRVRSWQTKILSPGGWIGTIEQSGRNYVIHIRRKGFSLENLKTSAKLLQLGRKQSPNWKEMCKLKHEVEKHLVWLVGEREISFWYDNWTKFGPLYRQFLDNVQPTDIKLKDVLVDGEWQEENYDVEWTDAIRNIINMEEVELLDGTPNKATWSTDSKGKFIITTAWDIWRNKKETVDTYSQIWHKDVPFKMAFITWRALTRRMPTDERLNSMERNTSNSTTEEMVDIQSKEHICKLCSKNHSSICGLGTLEIAMCKAGGTIRDSVGKLILAYSIYLGPGTSNWVEGQAMLIGLQKVVAMGINKIILEADSKVLVYSVKEEAYTPWRLIQTVNKIKEIVEEKKVTAKHCYREANKIADRLAAISHTHK
ncbi:uncharacterized protein [Nicotiana tomentosiformis]|uniref:uncharacterized protein n=1 Tax=Nicotiana tomentosiformis TaxID=4098 RepID=UPI00388C8507